MKNRIKQYFSTHTNMEIAATAAKVIVVAGIVHSIRGRAVTSADILKRDDGSNFIVLYRRNGAAEIFSKKN